MVINSHRHYNRENKNKIEKNATFTSLRRLFSKSDLDTGLY